MAHSLYLTPYYPPEVGAPQTRISEMAVRLVRRGHRVTVLTTLPSYPSGIVPQEYRRGRNRREVRDGVEIVRVWSFTSPNKSFVHRIIGQLSFGCLAAFLGSRLVGRPDMIIVESPPLFDAISGRLLAAWKRCPYIFTVADLWPEAAVQMGILRNRALIRLSQWIEASAYRHAAAVWSVTAGLHQKLLRRGLPPEKLFMIPNGVDTTLCRPMARAEARATLGWDDAFTVLFAGTVGLVPGLMTLIDVAERLRDRGEGNGIRIILVGDGAAKPELVAEASRRNLTNVTFLDPQPHDLIPILLGACDVCFSGIRNLPLFEATMPVKVYEAMGCGRPILLAAADGLASRLAVDAAGAALQVEPENASAVLDGILRLRNDPELRDQLGRNGRAYAEAHFDRDKLTEDLEREIEHLLAYGTVAPPKPQPIPVRKRP